MADIQPFKVTITQQEVEALKQKLLASRLPDLFESDWDRGVPISHIKRISDYWRETFSWRAFEERLNALPQFEATLSLDGFDPFKVHFVHQKSPSPDAIPLLFIHGWPGSFYEVSKILPLLTQSHVDGDVPSFHVVAPSLPNFAFSSRIDKPGFGIQQYAETCHRLMQALGYKQYAAQAGDWGSMIALSIGVFHPDAMRAIHMNFVAGAPPPPTSPFAFVRFLSMYFLSLYSKKERAGLKAAQDHVARGMAFYEIQRTRPNTIGVALADSPVGLLSWIYEKLVAWGGKYEWTDQEVCEWVSLYWFSRPGPAASIVLYHEATKGDWQAKAGISVPGVKLGLSYFPEEIFRTPGAWNSRMGDVVFEHEHEEGGHFATWEKPEALAKDLQVMFGRKGGAYGAVEASRA
ncbi:alpha/beta-hydrolase [Xylariomycetidae sp. FL2044]|nr:alpha/beta-hydrolase [Xylariomycetidae sp. FL2044]